MKRYFVLLGLILICCSLAYADVSALSNITITGFQPGQTVTGSFDLFNTSSNSLSVPPPSSVVWNFSSPDAGAPSPMTDWSCGSAFDVNTHCTFFFTVAVAPTYSGQVVTGMATINLTDGINTVPEDINFTVPEPTSFAFLGIALPLIGLLRRKRT